MCKRLKSRVAFGKPVSEQSVWHERIAEARIGIDTARLLTLKAAYMMDTVGNKAAKAEIAMIKVLAPNVAQKVIDWAIQAHGGGGVSQEFRAGADVGAQPHAAAGGRSRRGAPQPDRQARAAQARSSLMLTLCGFSASNYYNKVKLALLEKGVAFEEEMVFPSRDEALLAFSPMGKVPYLRTATGALSESQAIVEYLEEVYPGTPLYPADPMARAKCRELIHVIELYLELPARRLYPQAFFGGTVSEETRKQVRPGLGAWRPRCCPADAVRAICRWRPIHLRRLHRAGASADDKRGEQVGAGRGSPRRCRAAARLPSAAGPTAARHAREGRSQSRIGSVPRLSSARRIRRAARPHRWCGIAA